MNYFSISESSTAVNTFTLNNGHSVVSLYNLIPNNVAGYSLIMSLIVTKKYKLVSQILEQALAIARITKWVVVQPRISANPIKDNMIRLFELDRIDVLGFTALMLAVKHESIDCVLWLLRCGANPDLQDKEGKTALHFAIEQKNTKIIHCLIEHFAELDIRDIWGATVLHTAIRYGLTDVIELLIDNDAALDVQDMGGNTALHIATRLNSVEHMNLLLINNANPNLQDIGGNTAVHLAVLDEREKLISVLIKNDADLAIQDHEGDTALDIAISRADTKLMQLLIDGGASLSNKRANGETVLHARVDIPDNEGRCAKDYPALAQKNSSVLSDNSLFKANAVKRPLTDVVAPQPMANAEELAAFTMKKTHRQCKVQAQELVQLNSVLIQIPSQKDLDFMRQLLSGGDGDQSSRLKLIVTNLQQSPLKHILTETSDTVLSDQWQQLFSDIKAGTANIKQRISKDDRLLKALLQVHSYGYLQSIINACINARATAQMHLGDDVVITEHIFELLIRDIAQSLYNTQRCIFSFGLPTHHAYAEKWAGFCVLNKTAVMLHDLAQTSSAKLSFLIIGTDVNRDNGLSNILRERSSHLCVSHLDIYDSRVYPSHTVAHINAEFKSNGVMNAQNVRFWTSDNFSYQALDLKVMKKSSEEQLHPALQYALDTVEAHLDNAKKAGRQLALFIPIGWDSHKDETAACGKKLFNGYYMLEKTAKISRFSDDDLSTFYKRILTLYKQNSQCFAKLYWGLEGGYDKSLLKKQVTLLAEHIEQYLIEPDLVEETEYRLSNRR